MKEDPESDLEWWWPGLGKRFGAIVERIGSLNEAAALVGMTRGQLHNWRTGKSKMPLYAALKLCEAADVSLDWLVSGNETVAGNPPRFADPRGALEKDLSKDGAPATDLVGDPELLGAAIKEVHAALERNSMKMSPDEIAITAIGAYTEMLGKNLDLGAAREHVLDAVIRLLDKWRQQKAS